VLDLKQRGLLDDTLVVWGGEFGRTPMVETNPVLGRKQGRDHHPQAFTMWMAGGGVRGGLSYGATDEMGFHVTENPVHVHDLQATMLHLPRFRSRKTNLPQRRPGLSTHRCTRQSRQSDPDIAADLRSLALRKAEVRGTGR